jgi:hypothetical protein
MKVAGGLAFVAWAALMVGAAPYRGGARSGAPLLAVGVAIAVIGGFVLGTVGIGLYAFGAFGIFEGMRQWGKGRRLTGAALVVGGFSAALAAALLLRPR